MRVGLGWGKMKLTRWDFPLYPGGGDVRLVSHFVGHGKCCEWATRGHHGTGGQSRDGLTQHRPLAHALAQMQQMLNDVGLIVMDQQAGIHRAGRVGQPPHLFQQPGALIDQSST